MKVEWKSCFRVGFSIFLLYLCIRYWSSVALFLTTALRAASPLLLGCVIAYLVNILMKLYEKHFFPKTKKKGIMKSRRPFCVLAAYITLFAVVILVINLVVPELVSCIRVIFSSLPDAITSITKMINQTNVLPDDIAASLGKVDWESKINQILGLVTSGVGNAMNIVMNTITSVFSGIFTTLVAIIFSIYLLLGKDDLSRQCNRLMRHYLKTSWYEKTMHVLSLLHNCFSRYIIGQCIEAVILGTLCSLGMFLLGLPYATMIGVLIAVTALIPIAGAYIGGTVGALMVFSISPIQALIFVIFLIVLQQLEGNLIYPRVVGSSLGLPAIWVLAAVTVGGGVLGIVGMLLGVPLAAALYQLIREDLNRTNQTTKKVS